MATRQEIIMDTTNLSTKLAALGLAFAINSVIMGSVALMFNAGTHPISALPVAGVEVRVDTQVA
jgi:hypothetical protein